MIPEAIAAMRCPYCEGEVAARDEGGAPTLACDNGHSFDVARQGYVSLLPGDTRTGTADTAAMIAAREAFLGAGHFAPIADAVAEAASRVVAGETAVDGLVVEVGAGTGYYLARALDSLGDRAGIALDVSKHAARRAARAHPRIAAVVCDAWRRFPIAPGSAAVVLDVFAPRNAREIARILAPGGALVVVTPTPRHLLELRMDEESTMLTIDPRKDERLAASLGTNFEIDGAIVDELEYVVSMSSEEVTAAIAMGPGAKHTRTAAGTGAEPESEGSGEHGGGSRGAGGRGVTRDVTVSVRVATYRVRSAADETPDGAPPI